MRRPASRENLTGTRQLVVQLKESLENDPTLYDGTGKGSWRVSTVDCILGDLNDYIQAWPTVVPKVSGEAARNDMGVRDTSGDIRSTGGPVDSGFDADSRGGAASGDAPPDDWDVEPR